MTIKFSMKRTLIRGFCKTPDDNFCSWHCCDVFRTSVYSYKGVSGLDCVFYGVNHPIPSNRPTRATITDTNSNSNTFLSKAPNVL